MKKLFTLCFILASFVLSAQIKFTFIDPQNDEIKIKNFGSSDVDISSYRLCALFSYQTLNLAGVDVLSGDFNLSAGEEVSIAWTAAGGLDPTSSDLGLYLPSGAFSTPSAMVDFFQYGGSGQGREGVANTAGLWVEGTFLTGSGPWYYIGDGTSSGLPNWSDELPVIVTQVVINELDSDQTGTDAAEFVELFGQPDAPLDGLVVVFFNGSNDLSYASFDLDGYTLDQNGFFVLGNSAVPGVQLVFDNGTLQNGADAVAVYIGNGSDWPNGTAVSSNDLVDAIVYGTADPVDNELISALTPLQSQANEGTTTTAATVSLSRIPDGGEPFVTSLFITQDPTPGASNVPACFAGAIAYNGSSMPVTICDDAAEFILGFETIGAITGDAYALILAQGGVIVQFLNGESSVDFSSLSNGTYEISGFTYTGTLYASSTEAGQPVAAVSSDDCFSFSSNSIEVTKTNCSVLFCNGGEVETTEGSTYISLCSDDGDDLYSFLTNTNATESPYQYLITDNNLTIVNLLTETSFDFNLLPAGSYRVYGLSYIGELVAASVVPGQPATGILALDDECTSLSFNFIQVSVLECALGEPCAELYFSEYIEGLSNNKAFEIYNPTGAAVNLDDYDVLQYNNGNLTAGPVIALTGILQPGEVYVVANAQASEAILAQADVTGGVANFNGDDALVLTKNLIPIDVIGVIGQDPGTEWTFGNGSTLDRVLVRKPTVNAPTDLWELSAGQWQVLPANDFSNLGAHNAFPCGNTAFVDFAISAQLVAEEVGEVSVTVNAYNVSGPFSISVDVADETTTANEDYIDIFPLTFDFDTNVLSHTFQVSIIDDDIEEFLYEFFTLEITVNGDAVSPVGTQTISIEPSDRTYPLYPIETIITNDLNGMPDSLGVFCEIRGIVHGINFNPAGTHFTLIDNNAGIKIFSPTGNFGYTVVEGDSVAVQGEVANFLGMTEFYPDSIGFLSGGHSLETPLLIEALDESTESRMVRVECVKLVNPAQWTNAQNGFDVDVTDGINTFRMRIDLDTDIYGQPAPAGHFSVTGIGAQLDIDGIPYDSGYTFWPRYMDDIYDQVAAGFEEFSVLQFGDDGATIDFVNTSIGAVSYSWNFGDGTTDSSPEPQHSYSFDFLSSNPEITITLAVIGEQGCSDTLVYTVNGMYVSIDEINHVETKFFPIPMSNILNVSSTSEVLYIELYDALGARVYSQAGRNSNYLTIDTSQLAPGWYVISMKSPEGTSRYSLVKQ